MARAKSHEETEKEIGAKGCEVGTTVRDQLDAGRNEAPAVGFENEGVVSRRLHK
jgi:hypothetical protein